MTSFFIFVHRLSNILMFKIPDINKKQKSFTQPTKIRLIKQKADDTLTTHCIICFLAIIEFSLHSCLFFCIGSTSVSVVMAIPLTVAISLSTTAILDQMIVDAVFGHQFTNFFHAHGVELLGRYMSINL